MTAKNRGGRPSLYSDELAGDICAQLAEGKPLTTICEQDGMPATRTVMEWVSHPERKQPGFAEMYGEARRMQAHRFADEIVALAETADAKNAHAIRLKIDARKWAAARLHPEAYGDRAIVEHAGSMVVESKTSDDAPPWIRDQLGEAGEAATAAVVPITAAKSKAH